MVTLVAVLAALPALVGAWPAADDNRSAADLRTAALASVDVQFSGYAESSGGLALPVADQLSSLADLFSDRTEMRVWWRGATDNRVDVVTAGGETGIYRDARGTWTWEYEADRATRTDDAPLALPAPPDLLPNTLAGRLLAEAEPGELSRIGADRIAGRDALGPAPGAGGRRLVGGPGGDLRRRRDRAAAAGPGLRQGRRQPRARHPFRRPRRQPAERRGDHLHPATRRIDARWVTPSGCCRTPPANCRRCRCRTRWPGCRAAPWTGAPPAIGIYGRGITVLAVVPLPRGVAGDLRGAAAQDPNAVTDDLGTRLTAGPLGILLVAGTRPQSVIVGTVTLDALAQAAGELAALPRR